MIKFSAGICIWLLTLVPVWIFRFRIPTEYPMMLVALAAGLLILALVIFLVYKSLKGRKKWLLAAIILIYIGVFSWAYMASFHNHKALQLHDQAVQAFYEGRYDEAKEMLDNALKTADEGNPQLVATIYEHLGDYFERGGANDMAIEKYQKAQEFLGNKNANYYALSGEMRLIEGKTKEAIGEFEKALKIDPNNFNAHNNLGLIYMAQRGEGIEPDYYLSLEHNKRAYELDQNIRTMQNLATNYFIVHDFSRSLYLFSQLDSLLKDDATTKYFIGMIYVVKQDYKNAKKYLDKAVELDPNLLNIPELVKIRKEIVDANLKK